MNIEHFYIILLLLNIYVIIKQIIVIKELEEEIEILEEEKNEK